MSEFKVGQTVEIRKTQPASKELVYGRSKVVFVGKLKTTLADGSEWRSKDGYFWGAKPTRGIGRSLERRIEVIAEPEPVKFAVPEDT
jgi:hypothetical protein